MLHYQSGLIRLPISWVLQLLQCQKCKLIVPSVLAGRPQRPHHQENAHPLHQKRASPATRRFPLLLASLVYWKALCRASPMG